MNDNTGLLKTPDFEICYRNIRIENDESLEQYHDSCELAFFIKADIKVFLKDKQYEINDGDILFIDEYEIHKIIYTADKYYSRYVINFKKSYIRDILKLLRVEDILERISNCNVRKVRQNFKQCEALKTWFNELVNDREKRARMDTPNKYISADIKLKLAQLLIAVNNSFKKVEPMNITNKCDQQVQKVVHYIDEFYMKEITLDILERVLFLSKFYIAHIFKEVTGLTVVEYLQLKRVIEAQSMLRYSSKKIIDICFDCGFNSIQHFYRVFRKVSKSTPVEYKKAYNR